MRHENGEWMLHGTEASDPSRIRDPEGLIAYVEQAGFLPLFQNEIPGFSVEEHTLAADWWTGDPILSLPLIVIAYNEFSHEPPIFTERNIST